MLGNLLPKIGAFMRHRTKYGTDGAARDDNIIWRIARWVNMTIDTHLEYVIFGAFPLQKWLHERALILRHSTLPV